MDSELGPCCRGSCFRAHCSRVLVMMAVCGPDMECVGGSRCVGFIESFCRMRMGLYSEGTGLGPLISGEWNGQYCGSCIALLAAACLSPSCPFVNHYSQF